MAVYISRALAGGDAGVPDGPPSSSFIDVGAEHWAYRYVEYAASRNVVGGYLAGDYRPDVPVDRGQMAVFVARATVDPTGDEGLEDFEAPAVPTFVDVPTQFWAYIHVEYCLSQGIVQGYLDGLYHPDTAVARDQMAVYITRGFELPM
jgi:N-acetylmuramoyl-L-alanine amidase